MIYFSPKAPLGDKKGQRKDKEMSKIGNWIVTADIGGLTYAWKFFSCTAQEAVFSLRRKYRNLTLENVKVETAIN